MYQMPGIGGAEQVVNLTLYTDAYVIRGRIKTRQRRVTDLLNDAEHNFLVLTDVVMDEFGSRAIAGRAEYVQVNLDTVLFAVADTPIEAVPELRTPKIPEQAMISIPPFQVVGRIHLLPERDLRDALEELTGRFIPVTDAYYWSDSVGEARTQAAMVAINHSRAQILAPHREVDPWAVPTPGADAARAPDAIGEVPADAASTSTPTGSQDPWGAGRSVDAASDSGVQDPWGFERRAPEAAPPSNPWGGPGGDPWATPGRRPDEESQG